MRILVTGGAGFIGSHLCARLRERGDEVVVLDDLSTGRVGNLAPLEGRPGFERVEGSILDGARVDRLVDRVDAVFHLAAVVGVRRVLADPLRTIEVNHDGTRNVLGAAARRGIPVVFASSSEVYGRNPRPPFAETDPLLAGAGTEPRWSYAMSKAMGELLVRSFAREQGLPAVVVRLFNTVGPRQLARHGMVLPSLVRQALDGEPLTVFGDGLQTRCFLHVDEAVDALLALLVEPRARGGVFNLGGSHEVTMHELADVVRSEVGTAAPIVRIPYREAYGAAVSDLRRRVPDVTRIASAIGFRQRIGLEEIVRDVVRSRRGRGGPRGPDQPGGTGRSGRARELVGDEGRP